MSPKISLRLIEGEELARAEEQWAYSSMAEKCRLWAVSMCRMARGHDWYLEIDPDDGVSLYCRKCPADINDLYPDGYDLMTGEFEVYPGYVLSLSFGSVHVNGTDRDGFFTYGWRGPVTARVEVICYPSTPDHGEEWDAWVELEARHDA
jgi:hypothetical protein